jgi:hypothetical protein
MGSTLLPQLSRLLSLSMAIIQLNSQLQEIRGRFKGDMYFKGKHGHVLQSNSRRKGNSTTKQQLNMAQFAQIASRWRNMTPQQQKPYYDMVNATILPPHDKAKVPYSAFRQFMQLESLQLKFNIGGNPPGFGPGIKWNNLIQCETGAPNPLHAYVDVNLGPHIDTVTFAIRTSGMVPPYKTSALPFSWNVINVFNNTYANAGPIDIQGYINAVWGEPLSPPYTQWYGVQIMSWVGFSTPFNYTGPTKWSQYMLSYT